MLLLAAPPALGGVRDFRFGVATGGPAGAPDLDRMREERVRTVRFPLNWRATEVERPTGPGCAGAHYGWDRYDGFVRQAGNRRLRLLPFFFGSPSYVGAGPSHMPPLGSPAIDDYKCFVRAAVRRYGPGGTFGGLPITEWQVWNEPNLPKFAPPGGIQPREYARFVKLTANAVRAIDGRATIVLAGMPEKGRNGMLATTFLKRFYRVERIRRNFDAVAVHPYARNHRGVKGYLTRLREALRDAGDRRRYVWLTETGYATAGDQSSFLVTNEQGQAKKLRKTFRMIRRNRDRFRIGTVHWYQWRDQKSYADRSQRWQDYMGLYRRNGTPKPSCNAYARFTGGRRPCRAIQPTSAGATLLRADATSEPDVELVPSPPE